MAVPDKALLDTVLFFGFTAKVEEVVDVVHLVMGVLYMLLEALKLEIDLKTLLSTNKATRFLILLLRIPFLSQLSKFINNSPRKYLRNNLLRKQNISNLTNNLKAKTYIIIISINIREEPTPTLQTLINQQFEASR